MTVNQWIAAGGVAGVLFVSGIAVGWTYRDKGRTTHANIRRRLDAILGVFFVLIALGIAADVINLQTQFHQHITKTMACAEGQDKAQNRITRALIDVNNAAADYDLQFLLWLSSDTHANQASFEASIRDVADARRHLVDVANTNPLHEC